MSLSAELDAVPEPIEHWPRTTFHCRGRSTVLEISESQSGTTGCRVWRAARKLCRYLEQASNSPSPPLHPGCKVLELGCGCGLVGVMCAHLGANVVMTDINHILPIARHNVRQNERTFTAGGTARVEELLWGCKLD